ncbi:hypothetical protein BDW02DRAFT_269181 [Decorospora gaudefroyi]|uniref:Uncharacterized protein n=1 Tax=Decorospora gaudefroyi TaxID=184978 RepID=A0A6A5KN02_9PLEO|nr:hypothetical protein BDW02DRAFT_269181 [Decorospora gaudefroyi]
MPRWRQKASQKCCSGRVSGSPCHSQDIAALEGQSSAAAAYNVEMRKRATAVACAKDLACGPTPARSHPGRHLAGTLNPNPDGGKSVAAPSFFSSSRLPFHLFALSPGCLLHLSLIPPHAAARPAVFLHYPHCRSEFGVSYRLCFSAPCCCSPRQPLHASTRSRRYAGETRTNARTVSNQHHNGPPAISRLTYGDSRATVALAPTWPGFPPISSSPPRLSRAHIAL